MKKRIEQIKAIKNDWMESYFYVPATEVQIEDFEEQMKEKYKNKIQISYVYQEIDDTPIKMELNFLAVTAFYTELVAELNLRFQMIFQRGKCLLNC